MSEVRSRPSAPRGRGSGRGGRGGYKGGRGGAKHTNGDEPTLEAPTIFEDEGEIGELKKQYASKLTTVKEMFPDWTDEDIVFALRETDGDLANTIERISEGMNHQITSAASLAVLIDILPRQHLAMGRSEEEDEGESPISPQGQRKSGIAQ